MTARYFAGVIRNQLPSPSPVAIPNLADPAIANNPVNAAPIGFHHPPSNGRYYAVFVGTRVGVFLGW